MSLLIILLQLDKIKNSIQQSISAIWRKLSTWTLCYMSLMEACINSAQ